jgi:hypothetical protein
MVGLLRGSNIICPPFADRPHVDRDAAGKSHDPKDRWEKSW